MNVERAVGDALVARGSYTDDHGYSSREYAVRTNYMYIYTYIHPSNIHPGSICTRISARATSPFRAPEESRFEDSFVNKRILCRHYSYKFLLYVKLIKRTESNHGAADSAASTPNLVSLSYARSIEVSYPPFTHAPFDHGSRCA